MEQLRAISSWPRLRPNRKRRTSLIFRMDNRFWATRFPPPSSGDKRHHLLSSANRSDQALFRNPFRACEYRFRGGRRFYSLPPGIVIHIVPESLFTWLRNSLFTCPGIRIAARTNGLPVKYKTGSSTELPVLFGANYLRILLLPSQAGEPCRAKAAQEQPYC
jgi:hypothetical protein